MNEFDAVKEPKDMRRAAREYWTNAISVQPGQ
jgi:hypothetical protein